MKLCQILTSGFGEEDFLRISSSPYSAKSLPHHGGHVFRRIKISQTFFEKGHPRNNPLNFFQNRTRGFREEDFKNFFMSVSFQPPTPHGTYVFQRIKISRTVFEKGHPRNIPVKLFQNRTRGFRQEDFLRISSCPYLPLIPAMFFDGSKFSEQFFEKGHPREQSCEIILNSDLRFRRRFFKNFFMSI